MIGMAMRDDGALDGPDGVNVDAGWQANVAPINDRLVPTLPIAIDRKSVV